MRVVINTIPLLSPLTGIGKYTWQISRALAAVAPEHAYSYYYGYYSRKLFCANQADESKGVNRLKDALKNIPGFGRSLRRLKGAAAVLSPQRFELYFEPNYIPIGIRARKTVVTVPDFSPFLHPQWHRRELVEYFQRHFARRIAQAETIITISDFIRQQAIDEFGFEAARVKTVHLGYDREVFYPTNVDDLLGLRERLHLPSRFVLFVGSIEPRKNLLRLLQAYQLLSDRLRREVKLVLAGFRGWENREVMAILKKLEGDVHYLGYVTEQDLAALYNLADLFVYPSLYEGFGLPPLEAMACGCPVLVSRIASLPEVCGEAAAYLDPENVEEMTAELTRLLEDGTARGQLATKGLERAQLFSWERSAREHLAVFAG
ncbi:glycosyltransferase family 4 protein [Desulfuromonas sp. KJ2020]|uniref:glycosyltransferase family 4 protein n=1 Tax=Desulfuromonas sp. KJ2020 TaxID=2919173 RepID=UPI0020A6F511|nr:glycosyltransferase family 4 protein [Desulfuromonas sp. KJ2020]